MSAGKLSFSVDGKFGIFKFDDPDGIENDLNRLIEQFGDPFKGEGTADSDNVLIAACCGMLEVCPDFLEAYAVIGQCHMTNGDEEAAKVWFDRGMERGINTLPADFDGYIAWRHAGNHSYLKLSFGLIRCDIESIDYGKDYLMLAAIAMHHHLSTDIDDGLGVHFALADVYICLGNYKEARELIKMDKSLDARNFYNLALLDIQENNICSAITNLRIGFIRNPYIADIIMGNELPGYRYLLSTLSESARDIALSYMDGLASLNWEWTEEGFDQQYFLEWVYNSSVAIKDRLAFTELHEKMLLTNDVNERVRLISELPTFFEGINDLTSTRMIRKVNRNGIDYPVWTREAYEDE